MFLKIKADILPEISFSSTQLSTRREEGLATLNAIKRQDIVNSQGQNMAGVLRDQGGVFVQRSQQGGGSPKMRGFSANSLLLYFDGVRLNNIIFRIR